MSTDLVVCAACFFDPDLRDIVETYACDTECSFCGETSDGDIAAPLDLVAEHMLECLALYYDDAANHLPYETREGGYQGPHWDTYELLYGELGFGLPNDHDDTLLGALVDALGDQTWCEADPFSLDPDAHLRLSWADFCKLISHRRRFFFLNEPREEGSELLDATGVLDTLADYVQKTDRIRLRQAAVPIFRARYLHPGEQLTTPQDLGPPPIDKALITNRMSPPGIVMFYVAEDADTALRETVEAPADFAIGEFLTTRATRVLDLVDLPPVPGIFAPIPDSMEYNPRHVLAFLHHIAADISKPIARDDRVHVSYVPTQVVTEFFRSLKLDDGSRLDGIRYASSRHPGHASLVLFVDQGNLVLEQEPQDADWPPRERWVRLVGATVVPVTQGTIDGWGPDLQLSFKDDL